MNGDQTPQPLNGLRVVEFTHMVMGPTCGMVLADMGAEVIKVEPIDGDRTRFLLGAGAGFFPMFNRNKKSIAIDLRNEVGAQTARELAASADVVLENFKPNTMHKYGLDYATLSKTNPRLIYVGHKGFLPGPYEHRTALDEVVQMMGGLAYMTGRPGDPLRAGTSVNDIMGGMFGAIGTLGALIQRGITGKGMEVQSALFENNVFLMGQHMLQYAVTGKHPAPMPARVSPWAIYDVFTVKNGEQIFLAAVSDAQWATFCDALGYTDLKADPSLATNNQRVHQRPTLLKTISERLALRTADELAALFEKVGLPFAPIRKPEDLYDDPHLKATGGLADIRLPDGERAGQTVKTTLFPITMQGKRLGVRMGPPKLGEHTRELLNGIGYSQEKSTCCSRRRSPSSNKEKEMQTNAHHASKRRTLIGLSGLALGTSTLWSNLALSQTKVVRFILPVATASGVDTITRASSQALSAALGHPVVVENQPGAGGIVGTSAMIKSPPDGYTLSIVSNNHVIYPSVYKSVPFDPINDITPIAVIGSTPIVFVVNPKVPAKDAKELIALLKAKPGGYNYGSSGNGTILHLAAEMFMDEAGVKATHVPYKGVGPMLTDLIGGQVEMGTLSLPSIQPHLKSGALRNRHRHCDSSCRRARYSDDDRARHARLPGRRMVCRHRSCKMSAADVANQRRIRRRVCDARGARDDGQAGNTINVSTPEFAAKFFRDEMAKYAKLVKKAGVELQ